MPSSPSDGLRPVELREGGFRRWMCRSRWSFFFFVFRRLWAEWGRRDIVVVVALSSFAFVFIGGCHEGSYVALQKTSSEA